MASRKERDILGEVQVPSHVYYGSFTQRAFDNFQISSARMHPLLIKALAMVKLAAAQANMDLRVLDKKRGKAIAHAAQEVISGKFHDQFILDMYQAGAGTPMNMNMNEVIANRANENLGAKLGTYQYVHPNNHVNMAQSSNNVIPTATRLCAIFLVDELIEALVLLEKSLEKKSVEFDKIIKVGRTHLQDAVPIRLGQEFHAYAVNIRKAREHVMVCVDALYEIGLGGTAIGTGITAHPNFRAVVCKKLSKLSGKRLRVAEDGVAITQSMQAFVQVSASLKNAAIEIAKIANDFNLMTSSDIHELNLPEVEPGSSIMPGKINPSITEAMKMICYQVIGNDAAITLGSNAGQLELNVMTPLIGKNLFHSIYLLNKGIHMFVNKCVKGIVADTKKIEGLFENSLCVATALNPYLGYEMTGRFVRHALLHGVSLKQVILQSELLDEGNLAKIFDQLTEPRKIDSSLQKRVAKKLEKFKYG